MQKKSKNIAAGALSGLLLSVVVLFLLAGCSKDNGYSSPTGPGGGTPGANEVWIQNSAYSPTTITVDAGTTITWINKDNVTHTVTSGTPGNPNGMFNSGNMGHNATFTYTFNTAGSYSYYCIPHSATMHGTVVTQ